MAIFSHSRLSTFETCPRKFAFQYIEKPPIVKRTSIEAFMGSSAHEVLEKLYQSVQMERTPKWEEIRDLYEGYWDRNLNDDVFIVRKEYTANDYRNVGRRCLQDYFVRHYPFRNSRILGLEERVLIDLDGTGQYKLQGYIDRISAPDDGMIEIHDYKTSRRLPSQEEVDRERQLALYQIGIADRWEHVQSVRLIWHYLRHDRALVSVRSQESLQQLKTDTCRVIDTIRQSEKEDDFAPHESALCDWCDFQSLCPAKRHLFSTAEMSADEFAADDGVRIADQFVDAHRKRQEAEVELRAARQLVINFANGLQVTRLAGHNSIVGVTRRIVHKIPSKKSPDRELLESVVHASGHWHEVSELSGSKMPKALQTDLFDEPSREQIAAMMVREEVVTVTMKSASTSGTDERPYT